MVEKGRVAAIMTGGSGGRMIYDEKAEVLHVDLALTSVSRQPIPDDVFELPRGYRKMDFSRMAGR